MLLVGSTALTAPALAQSLSQSPPPAPTFAIQGSNILLNGNNSLRIDDNDQIRIGTTGLTFAVRVNIPNTVNLNPDEGTEVFPIFDKFGRGSPTPQSGYELAVSNGNVQLQASCGVGDCSAPRINGPAVGQGMNVHLAAVIDKTNNTIKLFRNGAQVGTTGMLTANVSYDNTLPLVIGMPAETNPQQTLQFFGFNGTMTDIAFYNSALTDTNIAQLAGGTLPGTVDTITINALLGGNGELQLGSGKTLSVGRSGTSTTGTGNTFSGTLSGAGNLLKEGTGNWTFAGQFTSSGSVTVQGGTLTFSGNNRFLSTTPVTVSSGATLSLNGTDQAIGSLTGNGGVQLSSSLTVGGGNASSTFTGAITGTGSLVKVGTGTLTLTGSNTYSGGTTVSGGLLSGSTQSLQGNIVNNAAVQFSQGSDGTYGGAMSGTGSLTKSGSGTLILTGANTYTGGTTVSEGTLRGNATSITGNIANSGTVEFDQASAGTYAGAISGSGSLSKTGGGTLTLSGASSYTGATIVNAGTLQLGAANRLPDVTPLTVMSGATFALGGFADAIGSLAGAGTVNLTNTLTVGATNASTTFSGTIVGTGSLTKTGTGTLTLTGANTYTGGTTVSQGTLQVSTATLPGNVAIGSGATLLFDQPTDGTFAGAISGAGGVTKSGAGTLTLSGATTYTGPTIVLGGVLRAAGGSVAGPVANSGSLVVDQATDSTVAGPITGTGSLTKQGAGTLTLTGSNSFTGGTTVSAGTLVGSTTSLPGNVANTANLVFDQASDGTYSGTVSGTGTFAKRGAGRLTLDGNVTASTARVDAGDLRIGAGRRLTAQTLTLAGGSVSGNGVIAATLMNTGGTVAPGTSPGTLSIEGSYVQSGGTLQLEIAGRNPGQFDQLVTTGVVDIQGGTIQLLFQDFVPEDGETFALIVAGGGLTVAPGVTVDVDGLTADQLSRFNFAGGVFTSGATMSPGELQAQTIEETSETTTRTSVTVVTTVLANRIRNLITGGGPLSRAPRGTFTQPGGGLAPTPAPSGGTGAPTGPVEVESGASGGDGTGGMDLTGVGVWADADYTKLQDDRDGQSFDAAVTTFLGGLDRIIGERLVMGIGFGYETTMLDFRSFAGGRDSETYTGIAYAAYALDETFTLSGQVAYGSAANDVVETRGTTTSAGEYDSARYTAGASLLALVPYERWELVGTLGYTFAKEAFDTYVSSRNEVVSPSATRVGLVQVGGEAGYAFEDGVTPYLAMNWTYDHFATDRNDGTGRASDPSGLEVAAGLRLFLSDQLTGGVVVRREFDRKDETSYAGAINIRYQF